MLEGSQVGSYRILRRIGDGGMGSVWLAEHVMLGRRAAIKVLHPELSSQPEFVGRFFNEARAATAIGDPGIVQIFDFGHHVDGSAYIVMELLEGEPLDQRLGRQGPLSLAEGLRLMRQIASTLGTAHAQGIVHRDLKPENVFIVRDREVAGGERAKILDFGIAKLTRDASVKTLPAAVMGTPSYMSPEQCRGAGLVDQRSDVYALGCMMFTVLVGCPPFNAEGVGDIIAMHLRVPPPVPSSMRRGIPARVDQIVLRCLAKDPALRFAHSGELAIALDSLEASPEMGVLGPSAASAPSSATTMSASTGVLLARPAAEPRSRALFIALGAAASGGLVIAATLHDEWKRDHGEPEPAPASGKTPSEIETAPLVIVDRVPAHERSMAPSRPVQNAEVATRMKDVLTRFRAWSVKYPGRPCPHISELGGPAQDPWGSELQVTCTDQPDDHIIGVISLGPDRMPGTDDDVPSWKLLDPDVTSVRGARWGSPRLERAAVSSSRRKLEPKLEPDKALFDENGIPIKR